MPYYAAKVQIIFDIHKIFAKRVKNSCIYAIFVVSLQPISIKMSANKYIIGVVCALCVSTAWADDVRKPDTQIADHTFFDPTRKEKPEEVYQFGMEYRLEAGYVQHNQFSRGEISYPDLYLHGVRIGATFTFLLPKHFSLQTGLLYTLVYGRQQQHWRSMDAPSVQEEYIQHRVLEHNLTIPVRAYYTIPLWKQLNMFFYTGPQLHIGLAETDYIQTHLSEGTKAWLDSKAIPTSTYDRMAEELVRANIQYGVGGGFEWDKYRLQAGYDFGLNNLVKKKTIDRQHMWEWAWFVSFSYRL